MRGAADAAGARGDDEARLRVLVAQDDLEAAEQFGLRPGVDDAPVLHLDADVEIALDAADRRNVECLNGCFAMIILPEFFSFMARASGCEVRRRRCPPRPRPARRPWRRRSA